MSFNSINPVTVGAATKKDHYDRVFDNTLDLDSRVAALIPAGVYMPYGGRSAPTGWLFCNGGAISRATYATLFAAIAPTLGTFTVTIASPGVFTLNAHGLVAGDTVYFTTTGALPTGLSANTIYYVIAAGLTANNFEVSATRGGAAINTSGSQSGVHTAVHCPFGLGDGATTFNVPDLRGRSPLGAGTGSGLTARAAGEQVGAETVALAVSEIPAHAHPGSSVAITDPGHNHTQNAHTHTTYIPGGDGGTAEVDDAGSGNGTQGAANPSNLISSDVATNIANTTGITATPTIASQGGGGAHANMHPSVGSNFIIKT